MTIKLQNALTIILGSTLAAAAQTSAPPVKDDLFAGTEKFAQGATSVTQIDMDPDTLGKVEGKDGLKAHRTVLSVVHTYEYDKPGMYKIEDVEAFRKKLQTGDWHCSVHIREMKTGESTDVCNKHRDDGLQEQAIITVEPKELTFIHTIGTGRFSVPIGMGMMNPEMQAEMAIARAEMQANMATMRPHMQNFTFEMKDFKGPDMQPLQERMKDFKAPNPEQMQRLQEDLKGLDDLTKPVAPKPQP